MEHALNDLQQGFLGWLARWGDLALYPPISGGGPV
jgi:hypothetical protein